MLHDVRLDDASVLDADRVRALARLARLELSEAEVERFSHELGRIVALIGTLPDIPQEPDTAASLPLRLDVPAASLPLRLDVPAASLARAAVLAEAPHALDGAFAVPTFVDEG